MAYQPYPRVHDSYAQNITAHLKRGCINGNNYFLFLQIYTKQDKAQVVICGEAVVGAIVIVAAITITFYA